MNSSRSTWWTFILYPENAEHMRVLDWLKSHQHTHENVYILHNQDVYDKDTQDGHKQGERKKEHIHVLMHTREKLTSNSIIKFFAGIVSYAEPVRSPTEYMLYMLHDTFDSMHKHRYCESELKGNEKMLKRIRQNANSIQFEDVLNRLTTCGGSLLESCTTATLECDDDFLSFVTKNAYLVNLLGVEIKQTLINKGVKNGCTEKL